MANGDIIFHTGKLHVYELIVAFGQSLGYTREYIVLRCPTGWSLRRTMPIPLSPRVIRSLFF